MACMTRRACRRLLAPGDHKLVCLVHSKAEQAAAALWAPYELSAPKSELYCSLIAIGCQQATVDSLHYCSYSVTSFAQNLLQMVLHQEHTQTQ